MIGSIIGDIVGSSFEFNNIKTKDFELFSKDCSFTDDTICTVAIADAIYRKIDYKDALLQWCRKYPNPKGSYGVSFERWWRSDNPKPYNSFGNGSAMRVSQIGFYFNSLDKVLEEAKKSAIVSHNHKEGIKGAQSIAGSIFKLRTGDSKEDLKKWIASTFGYDLSSSLSYIRLNNKFDETCQVTVPQAIVCFLKSDGFEDTIRNAVSIGGDSDTITCIAGGLAEAFYVIPDDIFDKAYTYLDKDIKMVLKKAFRTKFLNRVIETY
jgi:ADP-ribosyl-[dinitrogen reductase] hydrolase